jgi:ElaB/YqjD/DUF883 family membrane-anchored ribosome-binding protein
MRFAWPRRGEQLSARRICKFARPGYVAGMDTRERISELVENPEQVQELAAAVQEEGKKWLAEADDFIRRNPYLAIGIAVAAGCAIASLIRSRD